MSAFIDLTGQKFNMLMVIKRVENKGKLTAWLCKCDCGNETIVVGTHLKNGHTKSCGCIRKHNYENGICHRTHGLSKADTYSHWHNIKTRCYNKNNSKYKNYGARGITMFSEWTNNFEQFHEYVINLPNYKKEGYTSLDRIDNNGNYEPGNVRWATHLMQANNKQKTRVITHKGKTLNLAQWCKLLGLSKNTIYERLNRGWSEIEAIKRKGSD